MMDEAEKKAREMSNRWQRDLDAPSDQIRDIAAALRAERQEADLMRSRVAEIVAVVARNKALDRDWLLEVLTAPVFRVLLPAGPAREGDGG